MADTQSRERGAVVERGKADQSSQQLQTWLLLSEPHQLRENVGLLETAHALVYLLSLELPCSCLMFFVDGDVCASDDASAASHAGSNAAVQL